MNASLLLKKMAWRIWISMHAWSHYRTSIRVLVTEGRRRLIPVNGGMCRVLWIAIVRRRATIITVLVVVVWWGRLRSIVVDRTIALTLIVYIAVVGVDKRELPELRSSTGFSNRLEHFLLISPSGDCNLLHRHVYLNVVHT